VAPRVNLFAHPSHYHAALSTGRRIIALRPVSGSLTSGPVTQEWVFEVASFNEDVLFSTYTNKSHNFIYIYTTV